jgi:hypothetical protein
MKLINSLYTEPDKWHAHEYWLVHDSGAQVWISNGLWFYQTQRGCAFRFRDKLKFAKAYRWWCLNAPVTAFAPQR